MTDKILQDLERLKKIRDVICYKMIEAEGQKLEKYENRLERLENKIESKVIELSNFKDMLRLIDEYR